MGAERLLNILSVELRKIVFKLCLNYLVLRKLLHKTRESLGVPVKEKKIHGI